MDTPSRTTNLDLSLLLLRHKQTHLPSILVSSFALYSVLLMASSTPYPESRVFFSVGLYQKKVQLQCIYKVI